MSIKRENPFIKLFVSVAVIICLMLSIIFLVISSINEKFTQTKYNQEKVELLIRDLENQLQTIEDVSMRIAFNYKFQPYWFRENIIKKMSMLEDLAQFKYISALSDEYFIYYGDGDLYRSTGRTLNLQVFLKSKSEEESELFLATLAEMREEVPYSRIQQKTMCIFDDIYILFSFAAKEENIQKNAVLGFVIKETVLDTRFQTISGGAKGNITLYRGTEMLYCNEAAACTPEQKNVLTARSSDGLYTLCYLPKRECAMQNGLFWLLFLLVLADVILVFTTSHIYAYRAYKPIKKLSDKYRGNALEEVQTSESALEEIDDMMAGLMRKNIEANLLIQQRQKMLRDQMLRMLLDGNVSVDLLSELEEVKVSLFGPFFYVIGISFEDEKNVTEEFFVDLQIELEKIYVAATECIYTICNFKEKLIQVICSIQEEERKDELTEIVCNVAESFDYEPITGVGNVYRSLTYLSASCMESLDDIQNKKGQQRNKKQKGFIYDSGDVHSIITALEAGNEEKALKILDGYVVKLEKGSMSMLMLQYIFADFLGEVSKLSKKYRVELSKKSISMLIVTKDVQGFKNVAENIIHEFNEKLASIRCDMEEDELSIAYEYINAHFVEYDLSIEKVAQDLHISVAAVRQAVQKYTGKSYKDYLIYKRIEYAKVLLRSENMTVAEACQRVGYGNVSHFIKVFKDMTGVTPARFKKDIIEW